MSEFFIENGDEKAGLFEVPKRLAEERLSLEEALARRYGGDPAEWIPEAQAIHEETAKAIREGGSMASINPQPQSEGIFAGYHEN